MRNEDKRFPLQYNLLTEIGYFANTTHLIPTILFIFGALTILVSIIFPYWSLVLEAPQYPEGLHVEIYVNKVAGDIGEIDGLNHYIGMRPLEHAAQLERTLSISALTAMSFMVLGAIFARTKRVVLLTVPLLLFPFVFIADIYFWLRTFGQNLDPTAALSSSIQPFTQPIVGSKEVANFVTTGALDIGFYMACLATVFVLIGLFFHRKIYKPMTMVAQDAYNTRQSTLMELDWEANNKGIYSWELMERLKKQYCELCTKGRLDKYSIEKLLNDAATAESDRAYEDETWSDIDIYARKRSRPGLDDSG